MKIFPRIPAIPIRDPVCQHIERCLRNFDAKGLGTFKIEEKKGGIRVTFDGSSAEGMNLDIALVRLAVALLDDIRCGPTLMDLLAVEMRVSRDWLTREGGRGHLPN